MNALIEPNDLTDPVRNEIHKHVIPVITNLFPNMNFDTGVVRSKEEPNVFHIAIRVKPR